MGLFLRNCTEFSRTFKVNQDGFYEVPIPSSHLGIRGVQARLLSPYRTVDMVGKCQRCYKRCWCTSVQPESNAIFFHIHGGGFIAQTSKSHVTYLTQWSKDTGIPILSIDYSLAPQAPYPRGLEEVFFAYNWMLQNFPSLGTSGKSILIGGDSAGGNLALGITYLCIKNSIRQPDNLLLIYPSLLVSIKNS